MKKTMVVALAGALVVSGLLVPAQAKKTKKKPPPAPVQVDQKFFLSSTGCSTAGGNFDYLSIADADAETECWYTGSGIRNEIGGTTGTVGAQGSNVVTSREGATRYWDTVDGVPLVLDASKPITGSIWTSGGRCVIASPCAPTGIGVGNVTMDVAVVGMIAGEEKVIGEFAETYPVQPGTVHEIKIDLKIDPALNGVQFETLELRTWMHGHAAGHGVINTNGDTSSFISFPALVMP